MSLFHTSRHVGSSKVNSIHTVGVGTKNVSSSISNSNTVVKKFVISIYKTNFFLFIVSVSVKHNFLAYSYECVVDVTSL